MTSAQAAAGWYPDPADPTHDRYWDGSSWTAHRNPRPRPAYDGVASDAATTSLILGIVSVVVAGFLAGIPAMVIGRRATREIDDSDGRLTGRANATAGFVTGLIGTLWSGFVTLLVIGVLVFGRGESSSFRDDCSVVGPTGQTSSC